MEKEQAQKIIQEINQNQTLFLENFLEIGTVRQIENLLDRLKTLKDYQTKELKISGNPLHSVVSEILEEIKNFDTENLSKIENQIVQDLDFVLFFTRETVFNLSLLRTLSNLWLERLKREHNLTPKEINQAILQTLEGVLLDTFHGGNRSELTEKEKLQFLALYNRFLIVIQNTRKDFEALKKKRKNELKAKREAMNKYQIPEKFMEETFLDAPSSVALSWAKKEMKFELASDYLKQLLSKVRRQYNKEWTIIDADYSEYGRRIYAITEWNKEYIDRLRYSPVEKLSFLENDCFLVETRFNT